MSSPRRTAKRSAKRAAKPLSKPAHAAPKPAVAAANGPSAEAKRLAAALERSIVDGQLDVVTTDALQALMAAACRVYSARTEAGEQFSPVPRNSISATDVMVTASGLLKAADLAAFELGMWQSWTGR
jgi:hypothetical protein